MLISIFIFTALVALGLSAWLNSRFSRPASRFYVLDHPNERSLHTRPTPRTGGVGIVIAAVIAGGGFAVYVEPVSWLAWLVGAVAAVAVVSFVDDRIGLSSGLRMAIHALAAGMLLAAGLALHEIRLPGLIFPLSPVIAAVFTLLYIVWMVNLYNFMDGIDGFAGGMAVFGFGIFALLGALEGHMLFSGLNLAVAAAAAGFLFFNTPPARIFMGDTGSSSLGLLAAAFSLWGAREDLFPFWAALIVFSPFMVDATVTLVRRMLGGEKFWQPHKTHYYQRLVGLGWGHRKTMLWGYGLMAACAVSVVYVKSASPSTQWAIIGFWAALYAVIAATVRRLETNVRTSQRALQKGPGS